MSVDFYTSDQNIKDLFLRFLYEQSIHVITSEFITFLSNFLYRIEIQMKVFGFCGLLIIMIISDAKHLPIENDDNLELSDIDARSFLKKNNENNFNQLLSNSDCVLCKFNMIACCKPNLCIKKRFRPDECLELKPR
jgi:hypothetical protein